MEPAHLAWQGQPLLDAEGSVFGTVSDVLVGSDERPVWIEVEANGSGAAVLVPAADAETSPAGIRVPYTRSTLHSAPPMVVEEGPSAAQESLLRKHFTVTDERSPSVVRSEEELRVDTEVRPAGRVRIRKWVDTDTVSQEVVLHQERLLVQREPVAVTNVDAVLAQAEIAEAEYEVVLQDEQVVASTVIVPKEVIRLSTSLVEETVVVEADLRHEEVAVDRSDADSTDLVTRS